MVITASYEALSNHRNLVLLQAATLEDGVKRWVDIVQIRGLKVQSLSWKTFIVLYVAVGL